MYESSWWGATTHDRRQYQAIGALEMQISSQARQAGALRRRLAEADRANKAVSASLSDLSGRVDLFMEYVDLRFELLSYDDMVAVQHAIGRHFRSLAQGGQVGEIDYDDIADYWLPPAAKSVLLLLRDGTGDEALLAAARSRDRVRTELFLAAAGHCFERPALALPSALALLTMPSTLDGTDEPLSSDMPVSHAWSLLWRRAAAGVYGDSARLALRERLRGLGDLDAAGWRQRLSPGRDASGADCLAALAKRCRSIREAADADPSTSMPPHDVDQWRALTEELVAEGTVGAQQILHRLREVRSSLENEPFDGMLTWQRPEGTIAEMLWHQLSSEEEPPASRTLALEVCAPSLLAAVEEFHESTRGGPELTRTVRIGGQAITVGPDGVEGRDRGKFAQVAKPADQTTNVKPFFGAAVAAAVITLALFVLALPGLGAVAVLATAGLGGYALYLSAKNRDSRDEAKYRGQHAQRAVERTVASINRDAANHARTQEKAAADYEELRALLTPSTPRVSDI